MTRAALRAQESSATPSSERSYQLKNQDPFDSEPMIHEDVDSDEQESSLQSSDGKTTDDEACGRLALRDITTENYPTSVTEEVAATKASEKKTKKSRSGRGKKKTVVEEVQKDNVEAQPVEIESVVEQGEVSENHDYIETAHSESTHLEQSLENDMEALEIAVEETEDNIDSQEVIPNSEQSQHPTNEGHDEERLAERGATNMEEDLPGHDDSDKVCETPNKKTENLVSKTPKFDPELHASPDDSINQNKAVSEDSFIESIKTRSPSKLGSSQRTEIEQDSFVEDIITRTPSKGAASPRVEDSVEALDELEEALEKFSEDLPAIQDLIVDSPVKQRKTPAKASTPANQTKQNTTPRSTSKKSPSSFTQKLTASTTPKFIREKPLPRSIVKERVREFESRPTVPAHRRATSVSLTKRVTSTAPTMPPKPKHAPTKSVPSSSTANGMSFSNSPAKPNPALVKKRVPSGPLSTSKPAFVPAKSEKPTTKSTFVLPGEAVAAKLKAQREERAKREEEAAAAAEKKNQNKTRPVTSKVSRPSVMPRENKASMARMSMMVKGNTEDKENVAPVRPATRPTSTSVTVTKRRPDTTQANTSARRTTTVAPESNPTSKRTTMSIAPVQRILSTSSNGPTVTMKGKEVFERQRNNREAELKERKEKEEAAKRARAEAAERGRQASREWAEKQKRRLVEKAAVEAKTVSV